MLDFSVIPDPLAINWFEPIGWVFYFFIPIVVPLVLFVFFWRSLIEYQRFVFTQKAGGVLLEIRIPREITKSPLAMEVIFNGLWQKGGAELHETILSGKSRPFFSFEIASIDGKVHFFVWTQKKFKDLVESQFYAHYPNIEVVEVQDYTKDIFFDPKKGDRKVWGTHYKLSQPDPFPIKTYIDFGLDKASEKEEYKVDPIASVLEWMGSLRPGEQAWVQIIIQAHRKLEFKDGEFSVIKDWQSNAKKIIEDIRKEATPKSDSEFPGFPNPTKMQNEAITAIERSMTKYPYEVHIRSIYTATKDADKTGSRVPGLIGAFRPVSSSYKYFNEIRKGTGTGFDFPWEDFMEIRENMLRRKFLNAYKLRSGHQGPYKNWKSKPMILTCEELATIWHLPGAVVQTPSLARIPSKKSEAPANLPI